MSRKKQKIFIWENWIGNGIAWGLFMFVLLGLLYPYLAGDVITAELIFINLVLWLVGGLLFGFVMKQLVKKKVEVLKEEEKNNKKS